MSIRLKEKGSSVKVNAFNSDLMSNTGLNKTQSWFITFIQKIVAQPLTYCLGHLVH
jgi:hypothetical protein